jgi:hypothetical protein
VAAQSALQLYKLTKSVAAPPREGCAGAGSRSAARHHTHPGTRKTEPTQVLAVVFQ